jgi:glycosyltransferase involved in cell wall biosynthesis
MIDATAIIMTKNEEKNIEDCLKSMVNFAKRIVLIDCGSTDRTIEIVKKYNVDIFFHEFEYYAKQFNWGIKNTNIDTEWIIRLDADERFPSKLKEEIQKIIETSHNNINGITIEADYYFLGKLMKHGLKNKCKMMLFKTKCGCIEDRKRDAHSVISEGKSYFAKNKFIHYDFKNLDNYINRYNWYATREMIDYFEYKQGKSTDINTDSKIKKQRKKKFGLYYKFPIFFRSWLWFIYNYIFRLGFLDGKEGYIFCYFECRWYRYLVDAKILEQMRTNDKNLILKSIN